MTLSRLRAAKFRAVGLKQVLRAVAAGDVNCVLLADDVDSRFEQKVLAACSEASVQVFRGFDMRQLGRECKIEVGAAIVGWKESE